MVTKHYESGLGVFPERAILLQGPQGCGKGTHGKKLAAWLAQQGHPAAYLEARELLEGTGCADIRATMASGSKIDCRQMHRLFGEAVEEARREGCTRFIFDGYPRYTADQADDAARLLEEHALGPALVVRFRADRPLCLERIAERRAREVERHAAGEGPAPRDDDADPAAIERRLDDYDRTWRTVFHRLTMRHRFRPAVLTVVPGATAEDVFGLVLGACLGPRPEQEEELSFFSVPRSLAVA